MTDDDGPEPQPVELWLHVEGMAYMCDVCGLAQELLTAVLDRQPMARIVSELSVALYQVDWHLVGGVKHIEETGATLDETEWTSADYAADKKAIVLRGVS